MDRPENVIPMTTHKGVIRDTGEVVDVAMPAIRGRRRKGRRKMYALMDLEALDALELTALEWEVLTRIMRAVNPETNEANIRGVDIAADLGRGQPSIARAMGALRDRQIIFDIRPGVHRVNAHIMFRGSNLDWDAATDTEVEPVWTR